MGAGDVAATINRNGFQLLFGGGRGSYWCVVCDFVRGGPFDYLVWLSEGVIFGDFLGREGRGIYLVSLRTNLCHGDIEGSENGWVGSDLSVVLYDFEGESALYVFSFLISFLRPLS